MKVSFGGGLGWLVLCWGRGAVVADVIDVVIEGLVELMLVYCG